MTAEKTEKQIALTLNKDCELVHCGRTCESVAKKGVRYEDKLLRPECYGDMRKKILLINAATNILAKRQALLDVGIFDENLKFRQEYECLGQRKLFYCVHEALSVYKVDERDKARLSNKYFEWKKSVKYVRKKHKELYDKLGAWERLEVKMLVWKDGVKRNKSASLWVRFFYPALFYLLGNAAVTSVGIFCEKLTALRGGRLIKGIPFWRFTPSDFGRTCA